MFWEFEDNARDFRIEGEGKPTPEKVPPMPLREFFLLFLSREMKFAAIGFGIDKRSVF